MNDKKDDKGPARSRGGGSSQRTGNTIPVDPDLTEFLERLWTRENAPERLELWRVTGSSRNMPGGLIFQENFRPGETLDVESCTKLAAEILAAAQNDCNKGERRSHYELSVFNPHQRGQVLKRRIGSFSPDPVYSLVGTGGDGRGRDEDEEDDGFPGLKPLAHTYLDKAFAESRRDKERVDALLGDLVQIQQAMLATQQAYNNNLQETNHRMHAQMQELADRALDREMVREREKVKLKGIGTAFRMGENLLIGLFGAEAVQQQALPAASQEDGKPAQAPPRYGRSTEQQLVNNFLDECQESDNLMVKLFGDWTMEGIDLAGIFAGLGLTKPGIFTPAQFGILLGVRQGHLPPEALDQILPGSTAPTAITLAQMGEAAPLITQSMGLAIQQLKSIRDSKRAAAQPAQEKKP